MKSQPIPEKRRKKQVNVLSKETLPPPADAVLLRRRAEARMDERQISQGAETRTQRDMTDTRVLVQELQIHQIELEMQNEDLRKSRVEMEALLEEYIDLYDFAPVGYFTLERDGTVRRMNLYGAQLLGEERARQMNHRLGQFVAKADQPAFNAFLQKVFTGQIKQTCEVALRKREKNTSSPEPPGDHLFGEMELLIVHIEGIATENAHECRVVMTDITDLKHAEQALRKSEKRYRELSIVDGLTQLYNSRHFYHQLKMEIDRADRYGQPLTIMLLDLDDFKQFNDVYGHIEGDQVLVRLGQVVKRCLRQTDSAYRYGGEEFTILLPMTKCQDCVVTAERIRTEFKREIFSPTQGQGIHVTVSIGVAQFKPQEDIKAFVHRVDQLMYLGKNNGKDSVCSESYFKPRANTNLQFNLESRAQG